MKNFQFGFLVLILFAGCSQNGGEIVVAKKGGNGQPPTPSAAGSPQLPPDHPPIGQNAGDSPSQQDARIPGPERQYSMELGADNTVSIGPLSFVVGDNWQAEEPSSSFRAAQFSLPAKDGSGEAAELAVFQGIGGSAQANIERWIGQFQERAEDPTVQMKQVNEYEVHILNVVGTFADSMAPMMGGGGEPQPNTQMLAAVVLGPGGPWQFKLTGPAETVSAHQEQFMAMIDSLQAHQ